MQIELLYFDGCPSWQTGLSNLSEALLTDGILDGVSLVKEYDNEQAGCLRILGSPSFRVNGQELWQESRTQFALGCRAYQTPDGLRDTAPMEALREKLRRTLNVNPI